MKTIKITKLFTALFAIVALASCVNDDEFNNPNLITVEPTLEGEVIQMSTLVTLYNAALLDRADDLGIDPNDAQAIEELKDGFTFDLAENPNFVAGFVVSSDEAGNWFEEIILQDTPESPTVGIRVLVDVNPLFTSFNFGRKAFVKLDGLKLGDSNGVLSLGVGDDLGKIPAALFEEQLRRSIEVATIVPTVVTVSDFDESLENTFVQLTNMQFLKADVIDAQLTYAAEPEDQFDGERSVESCETGGNVILSTSTFADFKALDLPTGQGTISGVLTRNFFGDTFNLAINSPADIVFDNSERCDPEEIAFLDPTDCDDAAAVGTDIFFDDLEAYATTEDLVAAGYAVQNIVNGSTEFFMNGFGGNEYLQINAFGTGETGIDTWVVTPEVAIGTTTMDSFTADVQTNFNNGLGLTVYVSSDYVDDVRSASWSLLSDVAVPSGSSSGFGDFASLGDVNTSCVDAATVRFAFRYQGSDESGGVTTRYHIDNLRVTGN